MAIPSIPVIVRLALVVIPFFQPVDAWITFSSSSSSSFPTPTRDNTSKRLYSSNTNNQQQEDTIKALTESVEWMNHHVMTEAFFDASPILSTMQAQCVQRIEIKESAIPGAGRGLFAKTNLQKGTIISFYPAHALGIDDGQFCYLPQDQDYFTTHPCSESSYLHCTDQPLFQRESIVHPVLPTNTVPLYLDVNPQRDIVGAWASHMINDGAVVQSNSIQGVLDYYRESGKMKNCIHIPWGPSPIMATVTTKKVKKGQELLTSYGGTYWLGVLLQVRGEEGIDITPEIQDKIKESAMDLVNSMKTVSQLYAEQEAAMRLAFEQRDK